MYLLHFAKIELNFAFKIKIKAGFNFKFEIPNKIVWIVPPEHLYRYRYIGLLKLLKIITVSITLAFETLLSLGLYFCAMIGIGIYAYRKTTNDVSGYMLGGRSLSPSVTALSAGASDMSGWMLMGLPGAMYIVGISSL